jgi:glycosyltransferase involved in cell wall biosynthesis
VISIRMLSIVMPVYNEELSIEPVIVEHVQVLKKLAHAVPDWEIVCVDDGSQDRTAAILHELQKRIHRLRVIRQENQGIYGALSRCYQEARGSHIFATGSDGQWPAENLESLLDSALSGAELVVGVRSNKREVYSPIRHFISVAFNLLAQVLFGEHVEDAGSHKLGVREIFLYPLISQSVFVEAERIIVAQRLGRRVEFLPIHFLPRKGGKASGASWKNVRASIADLLRCIAKYGFRVEASGEFEGER